MKHRWRDRETTLVSTRIIKTNAIKRSSTPYELKRKSMEAETNVWSEIPNGGQVTAELKIGSKFWNKSKRAVLWWASGIQKGKLTIQVSLSELKNS